MSNGTNDDRTSSGEGGRYLAGLHEDVREVRKDVGELTGAVNKLTGEWGIIKWLVGGGIGIAVVRYLSQNPLP